MTQQRHDPADQAPGDKVRIRDGPYGGRRGLIRAVSDVEIELELDDGTLTSVQSTEITNYSRAARKAWQVMPKRAGRPRLDESQRKKMVSLRLDAAVWDQLGRAVEFGWIRSREEAINTWVHASVEALYANDGSESARQTPGLSRK